MPVNFLNLPGLRVLDFKETDREHHVKAEPVAFSRMCPHCGQSHGTIGHGKLPLFVRDLPNLGKRLMIHVDAPRLRCKPCNKTFTATIPEIDEIAPSRLDWTAGARLHLRRCRRAGRRE